MSSYESYLDYSSRVEYPDHHTVSVAPDPKHRSITDNYAGTRVFRQHSGRRVPIGILNPVTPGLQ